MPIDILAQDLIECVFEHLPLQAMGQLGRCSKEWRAVVARSLPLRKKSMAEIFRRLYMAWRYTAGWDSTLAFDFDSAAFTWLQRRVLRADGSKVAVTVLQSGLRVDEDFPALLYCYLEEDPAERVLVRRTFMTNGDVLRILDWLQHLPQHRRVVLDLYNHNVTSAAISHPAVCSRRFRVDLSMPPARKRTN